MKLGVFSALTGGEITQMNADYLWHVVRQPVDFEHTIQTISQQQDAIFIDVGPSGSLATFVKYLLPAESHCEYFETINLYGNDLKSLDSLKTVLYTPESLSTRYAV
jgi:acyl transferase domain-containing protein